MPPPLLRLLPFLVTGFALHAHAADSSLPEFSAHLDAQWNHTQPAEAEERIRVELARWPDGDPQALIVATQLARTQSLQHRFAAAHATLDAVEPALVGAPSHVRVRYLLERGRTFHAAGSPARAVPLFTEALALAECAQDAVYAADAAHLLGLATRTAASARSPQ